MLAAAVTLGAISLPGGAPAAPTVAEVAGLVKRGPAPPPPGRVRAEATLPTAAVAGVSFPNYGRALGWRASRLRADVLGGRATQTAFYSRGGRRIAYTIVSGPPLQPPARSRELRRGKRRFFLFRVNGDPAVTWSRRGHTCVISGTGPAALLELAAWE